MKNLFPILVFLATFALTAPAEARGLSDLAGKYPTGLLVISQGEKTRLLGTVALTVGSNEAGSRGRIVFKGRIGEDDFRTKITLKGRKFVMTSLLPGIDGFGQRVSGKAKLRKDGVTLSAKLAGQVSGEGDWEIGFDAFGRILTIAGKISPNGGDPIFVNFTAG